MTTILLNDLPHTDYLEIGQAVTITPTGTALVEVRQIDTVIVKERITAAKRYGPYTSGTSIKVTVISGTCDVDEFYINTDLVAEAQQTDTQEPTGFLDPTAIAVTYDDTNRTITLAQTGGIVYYWRGKKNTLATPWTSAAHGTGDGAFYLSSADGTNFAWSTSIWTFDAIQVAMAKVSGSGAIRIGFRECHGLMPWQVHRVLHDRIGTYRSSGGSLTADTYAENTASDAATTPGFDAAVILDEDLASTVAATTDGAYTTVRIGANDVATFDVGAAFPFRVANPAVANTYLLVNNPLTGAETATVNNRWHNVYQILLPVAADTESQKYRCLLLQPQAAYTSLAAAQAEDPRSLRLGTLATLAPEMILFARITYQTAASDSNTGKCRISTGGVTYLVGSYMTQVAVSQPAAVTAQNVGFNPAAGLSATNVQDALEEVMVPAPVTIVTDATLTKAEHQGKVLYCTTGALSLTVDNDTDFDAYASCEIVNKTGAVVTLVATATINRIGAKPLTLPANGRATLMREASADTYLLTGEMA